MDGVKFRPKTVDENDPNVSNQDKPLYLFGKDVREIACFRESFICGICCGIGSFMASFLATSKVNLSTHIAFATLWISVFGYWFPCRYKYENSQMFSKKYHLTRQS